MGGAREGLPVTTVVEGLRDSSIATVVTSPEGHITWANPAMCSLLGRSRPKVLGLSWQDVNHPLDRVTTMFDEMASGVRDSDRRRARLLGADGTIINVELTASCSRDPKGAVATVVQQVTPSPCPAGTPSSGSETGCARCWTPSPTHTS